MTKAIFTFVNFQPTGFTINGHAGYDEKGKDIVCSAITSAVFTSINLINLILEKDEYQIIQDEATGKLVLNLFKENEFVKLIILNLINVLEGISNDYPKNLKINKEFKP